MAYSLPVYWEQAIDYLGKADPVMGELIARYTGEGLTTLSNSFHTLARSIVGQQISVKAADAVWRKLEVVVNAVPLTQPSPQGEGLFIVSDSAAGASPLPGERVRVRGITPSRILAMSEVELRACGLSGQKVVYMKAIAVHFEAKGIGHGYFDAMSDEEVIADLVSIKGVGKWTAEMFLIFHLMRPDVFPVDDIGVQKAIERHYHHSVRPPNNGIRTPSFDGVTKKEYYQILTAHAEQWRPYRTVATWYLWRALDPVVVAY
jgi:DNA-3-methyladenine glycosylase II